LIYCFIGRNKENPRLVSRGDFDWLWDAGQACFWLVLDCDKPGYGTLEPEDGLLYLRDKPEDSAC